MTATNRDLSTERVRLVPVGTRELRAILAGEPTQELPWEEGFPLAPLLGFLGRAAADPSLLGPFFAYVIVRAHDGLAIGDAGFHGPPGPTGEVEIGYAMVPLGRGSGLATEAVGLLVEWARAQPEVKLVTARVDAGNDASERLLARLGFTRDGERGQYGRFVLA